MMGQYERKGRKETVPDHALIILVTNTDQELLTPNYVLDLLLIPYMCYLLETLLQPTMGIAPFHRHLTNLAKQLKSKDSNPNQLVLEPVMFTTCCAVS